MVAEVSVSPKSPPDLTLYNDKAGEMYLTYNTEAELDFSFPAVGYFQMGKAAYRFQRNYERQWKKGICPATAVVTFPYNGIWRISIPAISEKSVESAFAPRPIVSLKEGLEKLEKNDWVSTGLTDRLAVGVGNVKDDVLLWFDDEPIAFVKGPTIELKTSLFEQEVKDFLHLTGDYARAIV